MSAGLDCVKKSQHILHQTTVPDPNTNTPVHIFDMIQKCITSETRGYLVSLVHIIPLAFILNIVYNLNQRYPYLGTNMT
jgi:hypothetical protein